MKEKKKHIVRNLIIVVLILIIAISCTTYVLYTKEMLPDGIEKTISKLLGKEENNSISEEEKEEEKIYKVLATLDEKYKDDEVEIIDIYNKDTSLYDMYEKDIRNSISMLIVDEKIGLISNEDGEILVKPEYDKMYAEMLEIDGEPYISADKKDKKYKINLKTFDVSEKEDVYGHGGSSYYFYDPKTKEIYTEGYDYTKFEPSSATKKAVKEVTGGKLQLCFEKEAEEEYIENECKVGYFDVTNGKIEIKPEYDKATLYENKIAAVQKDGKAYFIDENNEKIYDVEFEDATNIHDNKAWIKENGQWQLIEFEEEK